ncbi:MAG: hypothetical protein KDA81_03715 [Planctomycetaceae bacterium]|nr:hypothetical protein [Planctomycetaceae bacterium]
MPVHQLKRNYHNSKKIFLILLFVIAGVSIYDTYLTIHYSEVMYHMEQNPLGCWLIRLDGGQVGIFVRAKLAGTLVVLSTLVGFRRVGSRKTMPVTGSIAAYQTGLFTYLTFA